MAVAGGGDHVCVVQEPIDGGAAMIDRLVHHAEVLTLTGDSYRTRQRREPLSRENRASHA